MCVEEFWAPMSMPKRNGELLKATEVKSAAPRIWSAANSNNSYNAFGVPILAI
jgi:hypothetical protein